MLMNLFSVFDPVSYFGYSLNWVVLGFIFYFLPMSLFLMNSNYGVMWFSFMFGMSNMFNGIAGSMNLGIVWVSVGVFLYLFMENLLGLFPFIFTGTAHFMVTMGFGCVFWLSFFLMGWFSNFKNSAAHLVPEGSPMMLAPLMVIIESISHLMRPFTLSIRLGANMMAGHLIMGLLSKISLLSLFGFSSSLMFQSLLLMLEFGVAVIQGFVFSILLLLYSLEYY